jgi:hypothetical protein
MTPMLVLFDVLLAPGADASALRSDEVKRGTHAQGKARDEATRVGIGGLPDATGRDVRCIAVARRGSAGIHRRRESSEIVGGFHVQEIEL